MGVMSLLPFIIIKSALLCPRDSQLLILSMLITSVLRVTNAGSEILFFEFWRPLSLLSFLVFTLQLPTLSIILPSTFLCLFYLLQLPLFTSWSTLILATFSPHSCSLVCHPLLFLICYTDFSILLLYLF